MTAPILSVENIVKKYRTEEVETTALSGVSMHVDPSDFIAVMGPSGCGKSTLMNILGLLDLADEGQVSLKRQKVQGISEGKRTQLRRNHIGFIFQSFNLIDDLSIAENVSLALKYRKLGRAERQNRVREALEDVGIAHRAGHHPSQLSGGQQQRAAIARALVGKPSLVLADEPAGNLDSKNGAAVMEKLKDLSEQHNVAIVMVTHTPEHAKYAKRQIHIRDGQIV